MTPEEQDVWKLQEHHEIDEKVRDYVEFAVGFDEELHSHDDEMLLKVNEIMLPYRGIGPNCFMLNEFDWNEEILKFKNLYEYNEDYHNFQEEARKNEPALFGNDYTPEPLYNRFSHWARAFIDGEFYYLMLEAMHTWIYFALDDFALKWIEKEIPHTYKKTSKHGKKEDGGYVWDMRADAYGKEGWLEQIRDYSYRRMTELALETERKHARDYVFIEDTSNEREFDPSKTYSFGSLNVLKYITFRNFIEDCEKMKGDINIVLDIKKQALEQFEKDLEIALEKIKKTPPNVVKFGKKRKIIMSDQALDDLSNITED